MSLKEESDKVKKLATELSEAILDFETFLNRLEGRTRATLVTDRYTFFVTHENKKWQVIVDDRPVSESRLEIKIEFIRYIPKILDAMNKRQCELQDEITEALDLYASYKANLFTH